MLWSWLLVASWQTAVASGCWANSDCSLDAHLSPVPPWLASLPGCSGVLVGDGAHSKFVLTARHCFDESVVGSLTLGGRTCVMEGAYLSKRQDLALVPIDDQGLAGLRLSSQKISKGQPVVQFGYGCSRAYPTTAKLATRDFQECRAVVKRDWDCGHKTLLPSPGVCAGQQGNRLEPGDSGGPVLLRDVGGDRWLVAGIAKSSARSATGYDMFEAVDRLDVCGWNPEACPNQWSWKPLLPPLMPPHVEPSPPTGPPTETVKNP